MRMTIERVLRRTMRWVVRRNCFELRVGERMHYIQVEKPSHGFRPSRNAGIGLDL
jgi:hypothetical protein